MVQKQKVTSIVESTDLGASFSVLSCNEYGIDWRDALAATITLGFRRFRMMSYWSLHEKSEGTYDFSLLDEQLKVIRDSGCRVTLAIGIRQPRWPETHLPEWAKGRDQREVELAYMKYHRAVVERYKDEEVIESWQLENEFWLKSFGESFNFSRHRLKHEFNIIRSIDPERPIIMSVAHFGSLPMLGPKPDVYATSMYRVIYQNESGIYTMTKIRPFQYRIKRMLIRLLRNRDLIVHELQTEPWGPKANWEMDTEEQFKSIDAEQIQEAVRYAQASGITYIDMWGTEWWYWRKTTFNDDVISTKVANLVGTSDSETIA